MFFVVAYFDSQTLAQTPNEFRFDLVDSQTRSQLRRAEALLERNLWSESVDVIQRMLATAKHQFVSYDDASGFSRLVDLNAYLHGLLFQFGAQSEVIVEFRSRADEQAQELFSRSEQSRDLLGLKKVAANFFASSVGDNALLMLGDLELERGNYSTARSYWARIYPDRLTNAAKPTVIGPETSQRLSAFQYRGSEIPIAELQARYVLASILNGDLQRAGRELEAFDKTYPDARGFLGGQVVDLSPKLAAMLAAARQGDATERASRASSASRPDQYLDDARVDFALHPAWKFSWPTRPSATGETRETFLRDEEFELTNVEPPTFPLVFDDLLIYRDANSVYARNVKTGAATAWADSTTARIYPSYLDGNQSLEQQTIDSKLDISLDGDVVLARMVSLASDASRDVRQKLNSTARQRPTRIVGISLAQQGRLAFNPIEPDDATWSFHGCPLGNKGQVFVVMRQDEGLPQMFIACFEKSKLKWRTKIPPSNDRMATPRLRERAEVSITLADGTVFLNSNSGVVAALSTDDGVVRWVTHYPRQLNLTSELLGRAWHKKRILSPPWFHRSFLYVAPADYDGMFALDTTSGSLAWTTDFIPGIFDAAYVLGVTDAHVLMGGRRLWWLNRRTGQVDKSIQNNPFPAERTSRLLGFGRGLLSGNELFWPAREQGDLGDKFPRSIDRVFAFDLTTGQFSRQPKHLMAVETTSGNLILTKSHLIVVGQNDVAAFSVHAESLPSE